MSVSRIFKFIGGSNTVEDCLKMAKPQILDLFKSVAKAPKDFAVRPKYEVSTQQAITKLQNFNFADKYRIFNKPGANGKLELDPVTVYWNGYQVPLHTPWDAICYITSVTGAAPDGATPDNFYKRLLVLTAHFCNQFGIEHGAPSGPDGHPLYNVAPYSVHICWTDKKPGADYTQTCISPSYSTTQIEGTELVYPDVPKAVEDILTTSLGASVQAGFRSQLNSAVREKRQVFLENPGGIVLPDKSLIVNPVYGNGQKFGDCSETIPMILTMLGVPEQDRYLVHGFSIKVPRVARLRGTYNEALVASAHLATCENCRELLRQLGRDPDAFQKFYTKR